MPKKHPIYKAIRQNPTQLLYDRSTVYRVTQKGKVSYFVEDSRGMKQIDIENSKGQLKNTPLPPSNEEPIINMKSAKKGLLSILMFWRQ